MFLVVYIRIHDDFIVFNCISLQYIYLNFLLITIPIECIYTYMYTYVCLCMYVYMCMHMCVYAYVCVCIYMYTYIYIYVTAFSRQCNPEEMVKKAITSFSMSEEPADFCLNVSANKVVLHIVSCVECIH